MGILNSIGAAMKNQWCSYDFSDFAVAGLIAGAPAIATPIVGDELLIAASVTTALTRMRNASDPWCNRTSQSPLPPESEPPFVGGQCEGISYRVTVNFSYTRRFDGTLQSSSAQYQGVGKVAAPSFVVVGSDWFVRFSIGGAIFDAAQFNVAFINGEPSITSIQVCKVLGGGAFDCSESAINECGSLPPPPIPPRDSLEDTIDIPLLDDDGNPLLDENDEPRFLPEVPIKFFPPCISADGIELPFEANTPLGKICFRASVGFNAIGMPSIKPVLCPDAKKAIRDDILAPANSQSEQLIENYFELETPVGAAVSSVFDGVLADDLEIPDKPIMGIFVNSRNKFDSYSQGVLLRRDSDEPDILIPRIGNVRFQYLIQISDTEYQTAFSEEIPIKYSQQFVPCPFVHGAIKVSVEMADEWECQYQIARRKSCCDSCAGIDPNNLPEFDETDRCS